MMAFNHSLFAKIKKIISAVLKISRKAFSPPGLTGTWCSYCWTPLTGAARTRGPSGAAETAEVWRAWPLSSLSSLLWSAGRESICEGGEVVFNTTHPNYFPSLLVENLWICNDVSKLLL